MSLATDPYTLIRLRLDWAKVILTILEEIDAEDVDPQERYIINQFRRTVMNPPRRRA